MPRLFIAIDLPPTVKDALAALETPIPTARWVKPEAMHLTLRFIGADVPDEQVQPIQSALAEIDSAPFKLVLRGVGRFPQGKKRG
jgi:2'-5' RNA ligase